MGRVAYSIKAAARAASVEKAVITLAVQDRELLARRVGGGIIILRCDLNRWLKGLPPYVMATSEG